MKGFFWMSNFLQNRPAFSLLPLAACICLIFVQSLRFPLHDFSNAYFSTRLLINQPESIRSIYDIFEFNQFIWELGYNEVLADFYVNSPFIMFLMYPLALLKDAYLAKAIFNIISIIFFLVALYRLFKRDDRNEVNIVLLIPLIFFIPIRNQILFGQFYFLIFTLVTLSFLWFENRRFALGGVTLGVASLIKIFPVFLAVPLLFSSRKKTLSWFIIGGITVLGLCVSLLGIKVWNLYLFEIIPNAINNNSLVNFQIDSQSLDVFLKILFVKDDYYNPNALFDNYWVYFVLKTIVKIVVFGVALCATFQKKNDIFAMLSIWVVALFLIQSRTATYSQILWIIPLFYFFTLKERRIKKVIFTVILFLLCNFSFLQSLELPLVIQFSRMWLMLILATIFFTSVIKTNPLKYLGIVALFFLPFLLFASGRVNDKSEYVLAGQQYFMILDFDKQGEILSYEALGKNGLETIQTEIPINSFDEAVCSVQDNQIVFNGERITNDPSLKKKPVLVNNEEVYYLTDAQSRRGAFTIKKINIRDL